MKTNLSKDWCLPSCSKEELSPKKCEHVIILITWNEGDKLRRQLDDLNDYLSLVDVVIVDGASDDGSTELGYLNSKNVRTLLTCHEAGIGSALRAGLAYSLEEGYDSILTIDCNGKDGVDAIPRIIEKLEQGYDMVQASRFMEGGVHKNTPLLRFIGIHFVIIPMLFLGGGFWFTDPTNGFKGLSRKFLLDSKTQAFRDVFKRFNMQLYLNYCAARWGFKVIEVPARRVYPDDGSVPTKIHGLSTHFQIIYELVKTCVGGYNP